MDRATVQAAIDAAQQRSVQAYLRRQAIEQSRQQIQMAAQQCDQELIALDGEIRALTSLLEVSDGE